VKRLSSQTTTESSSGKKTGAEEHQLSGSGVATGGAGSSAVGEDARSRIV
jgi:hypothetical protein